MASAQQAPRAGVSAAAGRERHFLPRKSWGSWVIAVLLGLLTLFLALGAVALWVKPNPGEGPGPRLLLSLLVLACATGVWFSVRRASSRKPLLTLSQSGITSSKLREPVRWSQLEDVELVQALGSACLHLKLRNEAGKKPRRGMWGRNAAVRRINLSMLKADDQFAAYAAIHARLAPLRDAAGLGAAPSVKQAHEVTAFEQKLDALTPTPWALYLVMALNVGVWALNVFNGLSPMKPTSQELFAWGANSAAAVTIDGQYWRLLTATFLHAGVLHLALNMFGLWEAGRQICRWFGNGQFLLIYLGSALAGSALSLHFSSQQSVSVGASGAVFGVLGALLMAVWRHRERIPAATSKQLMTSQGIFVAYALLQGFTKPGIDNAAHVGGLVAGAAITLLLAQQMGQVASAGGRLLRQGLALGVTGAAVLVLVMSTPAAKVHHRVLFESQETLKHLLPRVESSERALVKDAQSLKAGTLNAQDFMVKIRDTHLPAYRSTNAELASLTLPEGFPMRAMLEDIKVVHRLTEETLVLELRKLDFLQIVGNRELEPNSLEHQTLQVLNQQQGETSVKLKLARQKLEASVAELKKPGRSP